MYEVSSGSSDEIKTIQVDPSRKIKAVSMRIKNQYSYTGLRLYAGPEDFVVDISWEDVGDWTSP